MLPTVRIYIDWLQLYYSTPVFQGTIFAGVCVSSFVFTFMPFSSLNIHREQMQRCGKFQYLILCAKPVLRKKKYGYMPHVMDSIPGWFVFFYKGGGVLCKNLKSVINWILTQSGLVQGCFIDTMWYDIKCCHLFYAV